MKAFCGDSFSNIVISILNSIFLIVCSVLFQLTPVEARTSLYSCEDFFGHIKATQKIHLNFSREVVNTRIAEDSRIDEGRNHTKLKMGSYNLHDFTLNEVHNPQVGLHVPKFLAIADIILKKDYDILGVQEIAEPHFGDIFARVYLKGQYYFMTTSTQKGRVVGFFIKKNLPFDYIELESHSRYLFEDAFKNRMDAVFPSDAPTVHFYKNGSSIPDMSVMVVHLKAEPVKLKSQDPEFQRVQMIRHLQVDHVIAIGETYAQRYGPDHRFIVLGDFNISSTSPTALAQKLYNSGVLVNANRANNKVKLNYDRLSTRMIDGMLVSKGLAPDIVSSSIESKPEGAPDHFFPSDHDPVTVEVILTYR